MMKCKHCMGTGEEPPKGDHLAKAHEYLKRCDLETQLALGHVILYLEKERDRDKTL